MVTWIEKNVVRSFVYACVPHSFTLATSVPIHAGMKKQFMDLFKFIPKAC